MNHNASLRVSIALLSHNRRDEVLHTLARTAEVPHLEVIVVDSGSTDGTVAAVRALGRDDVVVVERENIAVAGRSVGVELARGDLVLMLDDDAHPVAGTVEALTRAFELDPRLGAAGAFMLDVDTQGEVVRGTEIGTFDWFLRRGRTGDGGETGMPSYFFAEGGVMVRRAAYLEVGGYFEPYFFAQSEVDLAMRLIGAGWDVRYVPSAVVHHRKAQVGRAPGAFVLQLRVRNQLWFWMRHFPWWSAVLHGVGYGLFDLVEAVYRGQVGAWVGGVREALRDRRVALDTRVVQPAAVRRRAGKGRAALHVRLLLGQLRRRVSPRPAVTTSR